MTIGEAKREFMRRVEQEWLPAYCNDSLRCYPLEGFRGISDSLTEGDAADFIRALEHGVAAFSKRQFLEIAGRRSSETLFTEGRKTPSPRQVGLWLETVITVAAAARLHLDYGWPLELLRMQSTDGAFDLVAFRRASFTNECIVVEVKKSSREVDQLLNNLTKCCAGEHDAFCFNGKRLNAHRKSVALQARKPPLFWAVGPSPDERLFEVIAAPDAGIRLKAVPTEWLQFRKSAEQSPLT